MCGIAGYIDFQKRTEADVLRKMTDALLHRGPDASGYYEKPFAGFQLGLGHRRLSIIDLSPLGVQPMQYLDERYWIVFNGEVYNYQEIRKELEAEGHQFRSHSDTEVILQSYHRWGEACVRKFVGMFAFVLFDSVEQTVFCGRDRAGVKPLFYYFKDGLFLFGSELKALVEHPRFVKELNVETIPLYLQHGYIPAPHCIFRHTSKLLPAHTLTINLKTQAFTQNKYWDVYQCYNQELLDIPLEEAVTETEKILEKAFEYRMIADVPVGVFLSGGYDSTCLAALLQKNSSRKLKTFTIGVKDQEMDEAPFARQIAGVLGTEHNEHYCTEKDALEMVPLLPFYYDEPFADSSAIPTMLVSQMARQQVTVALSADAGDEIFGGYDRYMWMTRNYRKFNTIPAWLRKPAAGLFKSIPFDKLPPASNNPDLIKKMDKLFRLMQSPDAKTVFDGMTENFSERERTGVLGRKMGILSSAFDQELLSPGRFDPLTYAMAKDYQTYLVDDILQKVDRATMWVSLEGREPFLDQHVIEWAARLPADYKIHNGVRKYILKTIVHQYVSKDIMDRPKKGFTVPIRSWMNGVLRSTVDKYLDEAYIRKQGLFDPAYIRHVREGYFGGRKENDYKIWFLLMFQMWYEKWMR